MVLVLIWFVFLFLDSSTGDLAGDRENWCGMERALKPAWGGIGCRDTITGVLHVLRGRKFTVWTFPGPGGQPHGAGTPQTNPCLQNIECCLFCDASGPRPSAPVHQFLRAHLEPKVKGPPQPLSTVTYTITWLAPPRLRPHLLMYLWTFPFYMIALNTRVYVFRRLQLLRPAAPNTQMVWNFLLAIIWLWLD